MGEVKFSLTHAFACGLKVFGFAFFKKRNGVWGGSPNNTGGKR
jgi:hypothetical protein